MDHSGIKTFFNNLANQWDISFDEQKQRRLWKIFDRYIPPLPIPVLDLGCGTGALIPFLKKQTTEAQTIVELDIAREMLHKAQEKRDGYDNLYFVQADGYRLPFAENSFGTVFCFQVVPHFEDKPGLLREVKRMLRPDGLMVVLHLMDHRRLNMLHSNYSKPVSGHRMFSVQQLGKIAVKAGFRLLAAEEQDNLYLLICRANP